MTSTDSPADEELTTVTVVQIPIALYWRTSAHSDALTREFELLAATSPDDRPVPNRLMRLMTRILAQYGSHDQRTRLMVLQATERGDTELTIEYTIAKSFREAALELIRVWDEADAFCREGVELLTLAAAPDSRAFRKWYVGEFVRQIGGEEPQSWPDYAAAHLDPVGFGAIDPQPNVDREVSADGVPVLVLRGDIDLETAPDLRNALQRLRDNGATTVVLDAKAVEFLDSVGISVLIAARQRLVDDGGGLVVRSPSRQMLRTLEIAGLTTHFDIQP
jgi:anti-anti-sigma factor